MSRKSILITLLFIAATSLLLACSAPGSATETPAADAQAIPPVIQTSKTVSAEAFLTPIKEADIAFEASGRVVDLLVKEGELVKQDQRLAQLNDADTQAALVVAQAALAQAEATLAQAKAGATPEQIAVAEAAVTRTEATLAQAVAGATPEDIAIAEARLDTLRAQLDLTLAGTRPESLAATLATVKQAENALALAQADYDKVAYAADSEFAQPVAIALQNATLSYQAALSNYKALANGATRQDVAVVQAQVAEGQAALNQLLAGPSPETIAIAQAGVLEAEAALAQIEAGPTAEQIAVAEAGVRQAAAGVEQAQLALDRLQIKAPFEATATSITIEVGEIVSAGVPVMSLADLSVWQVETDDLTEIDVVKVKQGQKVDVKFDALPNDTFSGAVTQIKPRSETKAGDVTYTVVINLDNADDARLRWGMTAFVEINVE